MADPTGRYHITYNGEIYNFRELKAELEDSGVSFRTKSDTEVILALWVREGEQALSRLRGMYAFALWDEVGETLTLARDPFGIKPLYYEQRRGHELRFASQVRALVAAGAAEDVDPAGLVGFLLWGSVPEPWTIRKSIRALPAGHLVTVRNGVAEEPRPVPAIVSSGGKAVSVEEALASSVLAHLVSDVPVALFLSAGLDSALVAALAIKSLGGQLSTFTLSFEGWEGSARDEAPIARRVAKVLGTHHFERRLSRGDVARSWNPTLAAMDQPSIDGFNTFLVARAAREAGIKVALSGLGGDELFGSYPSFHDVPEWESRARVLSRIPGSTVGWSVFSRLLKPDRPKARGLLTYGTSLAGAYFLRRGLFLPEELPGLIGRERAEEGLAAFEPVAYAQRALDAPSRPFGNGPAAVDAWDGVQCLEVAVYLRNQLLRDSDWASMASGLELRVPLVDPILWSQLARHRFEPARSRGKAPLVRALASELPNELWSRPKTGFTVPVAEWMCPPRAGEQDSPGKASRRLGLRVLEEMALLP